jgi:alpha/beta superfamily hydrolase
MEKPVTFRSGENLLEGRLQLQSERGVIVTHPHPLYGGNMHNPVVQAILAAFQQNDFATLRFNFRGVGKSQGRHAHGPGEAEDVLNALSFFSQQGIRQPFLAGYSFGAWVNATVCSQEIFVGELLMVSPPVALMDFSQISRIPSLVLVVSGSRDDIAPVERIRKMLPVWNADAPLEIINGADHFYAGHTKDVTNLIHRHLNRDFT